MRMLQWALIFLGRICISLIFILSAVHKIFHWGEAYEGLLHMLSSWKIILEGSPDLQAFFQACIYFSPVFLILAILVELIGGALVFLGIKARLGAFLLMVFLIPTTLVFHHFWYFDGLKYDIELAMFLKNVAIFGGLLYILVHGSTITKIDQPKSNISEAETTE